MTDQLGSVRLVVDAGSGEVAQEIEYDPFGKVISDSNEGIQPFGFAGGLYDSATRLTHFGAREYSADMGRWTASDPISFAGGDSNLYGYVVGDPVNLVDPSGLYGVGSFISDVAGTVREIPSPVATGATRDYFLNYTAGAANALTFGASNLLLGINPGCAGMGYGLGGIVGTVGSLGQAYQNAARTAVDAISAQRALPAVRAFAPNRVPEFTAAASPDRVGKAVWAGNRRAVIDQAAGAATAAVNGASCGC